MSKLVERNGKKQLIGRRSKCTPEMIKAIEEAVKNVFYLSVACPKVGLNYGSATRYMVEGNRHIQIYHPIDDSGEISDCTEHCDPDMAAKRRFLEAVKRGQANFTSSKIEKIAQAGENPRNWPANAFLLERTQPDKFGLKTRVDTVHSGEVKFKPVVTTDRRKAILEAAQKSLTIDTQQDTIETKQIADGTFVPVEDE